MPDPSNLTPDGGPDFRFLFGERGQADTESLTFLNPDRAVQRASLYFFLFLILLVGAFGPVPPPEFPNSAIHSILEALATLLAFVVGSLALVRFYAKKSGVYLLIGTGFLGSGVLDLFHLLVSLGFGEDRSFVAAQDLASWSFTASGVYLSAFLLVSWLSWKREPGIGQRPRIPEIPVYLTSGILVVVTLSALFLLPVSTAFYPGETLRQPWELFPAAILLLALVGYLEKGHWRYDAFDHWMVLGLIIAWMAHGAYMPFAGEFYDPDFQAAHALKVVGYLCVLIGLMASVYVTFRREEEAAESAQAANSALAREIDFRRKAERVLQESEERLQDFLDNASDLIQSVAPDGTFLYVNRAWTRTLGYSTEEVKGLLLFDLLHPSCRDRCTSQFEALLQGASIPAVELDFVTADGRVVRCSGSANVRFQEGKAVATRAILRDMTAQMEARRELEAFQAKLQALVENTGDAIWSVDRSLRLITFNTAFSMALEARVGREPRVSDLPEEVFPSQDAAWYREMYQRCLKGASFSQLRDEEIGGQLRSFEIFFNPIREASGITGVAAFGKDVTARRQTQVALRIAKEEAERANRAKSQFLANMSHELRTPLNSVIGFTNILLKNKSGHLAGQELNFLERISANGKHLLHLINQTLDLAKIEAGRMELDLEPVDLRALVGETLAQMEGQVREKPVSLRNAMPEDLPPLETDGAKLKQVLINLVGNAVKFTERGTISVGGVLDEAGERVSAIRVKDTGIGIAGERLQAIFEAFQQADGTTSRRYGGTGLGLAISRSLCEVLGYELAVESVEGEGSTFSVVIPPTPGIPFRPEDQLIAEALKPMESTRPMSGEERGEAVESDRGTVLVIDDDPDSRTLLTHYLEELGLGVLTASSAGDGLRQARASRPDLITLDLMMPGLTGWEALREFKDDPELRDIPVVIVTMLAEVGRRSDLVGAVDLITKPVRRERLIEVLTQSLGTLAGKTMLVVEDDADVRRALEEYSKEAGLSVVPAENGAAAEARLKDATPDAILLDLLMPVMDGTTFLRRLRENPRHRGIPVVVCTGKELTRKEQERLEAKAAGIVTKGEGFDSDLREILARFFPLDVSASR